MTLKYPEPITGISTAVDTLFSLPPQGPAVISCHWRRQLEVMRGMILNRLRTPVASVVCHPHRVGRSNSVAVHIEGAAGNCVDILVTVSGKVSWPVPEESQLPRWYMCVADAADLIYLMLWLNTLVGCKTS